MTFVLEPVAPSTRMGLLGGRIVAEVLLGLIDADPGSYRAAAPGWRPEPPARTKGNFTFADLLRIGGSV